MMIYCELTNTLYLLRGSDVSYCQPVPQFSQYTCLNSWFWVRTHNPNFLCACVRENGWDCNISINVSNHNTQCAPELCRFTWHHLLSFSRRRGVNGAHWSAMLKKTISRDVRIELIQTCLVWPMCHFKINKSIFNKCKFRLFLWELGLLHFSVALRITVTGQGRGAKERLWIPSEEGYLPPFKQRSSTTFPPFAEKGYKWSWVHGRNCNQRSNVGTPVLHGYGKGS